MPLSAYRLKVVVVVNMMTMGQSSFVAYRMLHDPHY